MGVPVGAIHESPLTDFGVKASFDLFKIVAAELFEKCVGYGEGHGGFGYSRGCRHAGYVTSLIARGLHVASGYIYRAKWFDEGRDGLHKSANDNGHTVGHAAFDATCVVCTPAVAAVFANDFVVYF